MSIYHIDRKRRCYWSELCADTQFSSMSAMTLSSNIVSVCLCVCVCGAEAIKFTSLQLHKSFRFYLQIKTVPTCGFKNPLHLNYIERTQLWRWCWLLLSVTDATLFPKWNKKICFEDEKKSQACKAKLWRAMEILSSAGFRNMLKSQDRKTPALAFSIANKRRESPALLWRARQRRALQAWHEMSVSIIEINTGWKKLQRKRKLVFKPHEKAQMSFPHFPEHAEENFAFRRSEKRKRKTWKE